MTKLHTHALLRHFQIPNENCEFHVFYRLFSFLLPYVLSFFFYKFQAENKSAKKNEYGYKMHKVGVKTSSKVALGKIPDSIQGDEREALVQIQNIIQTHSKVTSLIDTDNVLSKENIEQTLETGGFTRMAINSDGAQCKTVFFPLEKETPIQGFLYEAIRKAFPLESLNAPVFASYSWRVGMSLMPELAAYKDKGGKITEAGNTIHMGIVVPLGIDSVESM
jgi:hypothetical protein